MSRLRTSELDSSRSAWKVRMERLRDVYFPAGLQQVQHRGNQRADIEGVPSTLVVKGNNQLAIVVSCTNQVVAAEQLDEFSFGQKLNSPARLGLGQFGECFSSVAYGLEFGIEDALRGLL